MVEIKIDLYQVGYLIGRYGIAAAKTVGKSAFVYHGGAIAGGTLLVLEGSHLASHGYKHLSKVALLHKIDVKDASAVTENVFSCLNYVE